MKRSILTVATILMVALAMPAMAGELEIGSKAPDFTLTDQNGKTHTLSDYAGKTVVLEWTNPGCPFVQYHYKEETMTQLASTFAEKDVVWLAVDSSHFVTSEGTQGWAKSQKIDYPILLDPTGTVGKMYHARTTPHMFVISGEGELMYEGAIDDDPRISGKATTNYVTTALDKVIAGEKIEATSTKPYGCSVKYGKAAKKAKATS